MLYQLSAQDMLRIWERGSQMPLLEQARIILAVSFPNLSTERYACMSVGKRDALLYTIRAHTFGSRLACLVECPSCHERLEFELDSSGLCISRENAWEMVEHTYEMEVEGYALHVRVPTCADLEALAACADVTTGREILLRRCVLSAQTAQGLVDATDLPKTTLSRLEETLGEYDPQAMVEISMQCGSCTYDWAMVLDIVSYFWAEIASRVKRLLREVHTLAQAYGWREDDIMAMSATRRQVYLEMVGGL